MPSLARLTNDPTTGQPIVSKVATFRGTVTSDSSGNATYTFGPVAGLIMQCDHEGVAGSAPTDNWDYVVNNDMGADLMGGAGADCDTTTAETRVPTTDDNKPPYIFGTGTVVFSNLGNAKSVDFAIHILTK